MGIFNFNLPRKQVQKSINPVQQWRLGQQPPLNFTTYSPNFGKRYNSLVLLELYNRVGSVNAIINYLISKAAELPVNHVRYLSNGKKKILGETEQLNTLQNPNSTNTQNSYMESVYASVLIHGNAPVWIMKVPGFDYPRKLELLPAHNLFAIPEKSQDLYGTPSIAADPRFNDLSSYRLLVNGKFIPIPKEEICYIKKSNPNRIGSDWFYGQSPLYAAIRNIDILSGLYDTINTVTQYRGALGFIKKIARANTVDMAMDQDEKDRVEEKFMTYGTKPGEKPIFVTPYDLQWVRIDAPISDFMPVELDEIQFGHLCNQFAISDILLNSKKASTYNNIKEVKVSAYQDAIMPLVQNVLNAHSVAMGMTARKEWFEADYSGVSCLQEDEKTKYEAAEIKRVYFQSLYDAGLITKNQILSGLDMAENPDPSFNELKNESRTGTENTVPATEPGTDTQNEAGQGQDTEEQTNS